MRMYHSQNVYDAAMERINWLFDEFPNVVCSVSGGKDSTVIFNLCLQVAREKNRLPLSVFWLDQEAEWQATVDQIKLWMYNPDVNPLWMQFPFRLFNATSVEDHWLDCWNPNKKDIWVHPHVDISFKDNVYGTDRFHDMFPAIINKIFVSKKACFVAGMRCEESPTRTMAMTYTAKYKWITWCARMGKEHYTFYPIYDWSYSDVWKAIHNNSWPYNRIYDAQYRYGLPLKSMRVSNVHHETSVESLFYAQEVEPETYERIVRRIQGIDMAGKMGFKDYYVGELPAMFSSWREYRDYLLNHLISKPEWKAGFQKWFQKFDDALGQDGITRPLWTGMVNAILCNDWEGIKLGNCWRNPNVYDARKVKAHG